ncbi:MAG TPA: FecR domain-containing protein, partial [Polyangiaceae bacterium]|nr:FecR domain-containing protein [Polyangiaceae bacterium]
MNRTELARAWPAAEPPAGFSQRVVERLQREALSPASELPETAPRRASRFAGWKAPRWRWLALPAVALACGGLWLLWPVGPAPDGEVIAAEPRSVALGERVVAEMASGAHLRWSGGRLQQEGRQGAQQEVQQDSGDVTYRVLPGSAFRVQTPHGSVTALGTVFRVVVADHEEAKGEPMKKRWAVAGASLTVGALLWVSVERGSVRLSNDGKELVLGAGQAGAIGSDGVPRRENPADAAGAGRAAGRDAERARNRQVAD